MTKVDEKAPSPSESGADSTRVTSIDVLRGLTILVMMFVNDLDGVRGVPAWMKHIHPSNSDGMTFVDVVFPAFLFIVGMSIPFAIGRRLERGERPVAVWRHILGRAFGLLVIGFFMVNSETISKSGPLSSPFWELLVYSGVALSWLSLPGDWGNRRSAGVAMRVVGAAFLIAAAFLYRGNDGTGIIQMRPQWWGILGLIGWAYLVACLIYVPLRRNLAGVVGCIPLLYCLYLAQTAGGLNWLGPVNTWVSVGESLGSQAAVTLAGVALAMALVPGSSVSGADARIRWAFWFGAALLLAGILLHSGHHLHRMFIFNKNAATPPWCLVSSAITAFVWIAIYWVVDVRKATRGTRLLVRAGQNALLAYILAPVIYALMQLAHVGFYGALGNSFATGLARSTAFAFLLIWVAAALRDRAIQLRL